MAIQKYSAERPINGIGINGNEVLLNRDDTVKTFESIEKAKDFLTQHNATKRN